MGMRFGNSKAGDGAGSKKMGGAGRKPMMPSDNDGDEGNGGIGTPGGFKRGGKVAACARGGKIEKGLGKFKPGKQDKGEHNEKRRAKP